MSAITQLTRRHLIASGAIASVFWSNAAQALASGAGITSSDVSENGLAGKYYTVERPRTRPGVIMLNGSGGGYPVERDAADLAAAGFPTLALAYFQDRAGSPPGLPRDLVSIPIEYVFKAIEWMKARPGVDSNRVILMGESRGAELALLVATRRRDVAGIIGFAPSSHLWAGLPKVGVGNVSVPAWTSAGQPIPYQEPMHGTGLTLYQRFDRSEPLDAAAIPVERISGPVLLFSSVADGLWPSTRYADEIIARLRVKGFPHFHRHMRFDDASHLLMGTGGAATSIRGQNGEVVFSFGGSQQGTLRARAIAWAAAKRFMAGLVT